MKIKEFVKYVCINLRIEIELSCHWNTHNYENGTWRHWCMAKYSNVVNREFYMRTSRRERVYKQHAVESAVTTSICHFQSEENKDLQIDTNFVRFVCLKYPICNIWSTRPEYWDKTFLTFFITSICIHSNALLVFCPLFSDPRGDPQV